jgi:uncharacterized protein GlcG (DUF336 family)
MFNRIAMSVIVAAALGASAPAQAQLLQRKDLSLDMALAIATTASALCKSQGYNVTVAVLDRAGETMVLLRGDNAVPHTVENARRKAYTARTTRLPSAEFARRVEDPAQHVARAQNTLPGFVALGGALPIKVGDETIGAVGVSGAPGGERDEVCAKAGLDKVADQLK